MLITLRYFFSIFQNVIFGFSLYGSPLKPHHWSSLNICLHNRNSLPLYELFFSVPPTSLGDLLPQRISWYRRFGGQGSLKESQTRTQLVSHFRLMTRMFVLAAAFHCAATLSETLAHRSDICTADSVQAGRNIY